MLRTGDAARLAFPDGAFHQVCCIQNGISAFHVDQRALMVEAVRVTAPGGKVLFSIYAAEFWPERLEWFRLQADHGVSVTTVDGCSVFCEILT